MNPSGSDSWHPPGGGSNVHPGVDQHGQTPQRAYGAFGSNPPPQGPSSQPGAPVLPPPGPFYSGNPPPPHSLPPLADLTQNTQQQGPHPPPQQQNQQPPHVQQGISAPQLGQPQQQQQQQQQGPGPSLPGLGHSMQSQQSPPSAMTKERERESREREYRERELLERQRQQEEMMLRERDREQRERMHREQQEREHIERQREQQQHPVQTHTGSIPLQQPVALKGQNSFTGPNGILSTLGANVPNQQQSSLPPQNGGPMFGGPLSNDGPPRTFMPHGGQPPPQPVAGFAGGPGQPGMAPGGVAVLAQGQQPILNDALSYLDQVKVRFSEQPDVYNKFLDIMKDFKSQAIDTPGVIERVSTLFTGHPMLIQGFNTFLPPGYRIECGTDGNPDAIRVTTPMGTTVSSMQPAQRLGEQPGIAGPSSLGRQEVWGWQHSRHAPPPPESAGHGDSFSPNGRLAAPSVFGSQAGQPPPHDPQFEYQNQQESVNAAALAHQQEQRGVSQLQNAVSAATNGTPGRPTMTQVSPGGGQPASLSQPMPGISGGMNSGAMTPGPGVIEKRGPVEFNHAISYVNKIKNRFASQPEIYKQFLEILQTYQRESKPIQDVYAQVTHLFSTAPDLLEDFKQFLPESAAQAKAQAAARQAAEDAALTSNIRGEPYPTAGSANQSQTPRGDSKVPPLGNFAPPSAAKEKKQRRGIGSQPVDRSSAQLPVAQVDPNIGGGQGSRVAGSQLGSVNKRSKVSHTKAPQPDVPTVSPTLVPQPPEPLPPNLASDRNVEQFQWFDRAKKFINSKVTYNELLKLINLYVQDLIDKNILAERISSFIGGNVELMTQFKRLIHSEDGRNERFTPKARVSNGRVNLSHCRALGPSYRLLPKRERLKNCSGRDEMCAQVLNDEWASHPTWASEDSGFVAHRKNQFEEVLHRIEEERHDYDYNIEACVRTIQLIEPIVQNMKNMTEEDRVAYTLPPGLGGQSLTIFQRVIKKIYDRERGQKVVEDMFATPALVLPTLLQRLKQKEEEWKAGQREWDKVWREQTNKNFWKSLDHQGLSAKNHDRKHFTPKALQLEIQAKWEEQNGPRVTRIDASKHQLEYFFKDDNVIFDACRLLFASVRRTLGGDDGTRVTNVLEQFIPAFFGIDKQEFSSVMRRARMNELYDGEGAEDFMDEDAPTPDETSSVRGRRANGRRQQDLLRNVLQRGQGAMAQDESGVSGSKESTPDVSSAVDEDMDGADDSPVEEGLAGDGSGTNKWMDHPPLGNIRNKRDLGLNQPYKRGTFNLYANGHMYTFFREFQALYARLLAVKDDEAQVKEDVERGVVRDDTDGRRYIKPAIELKMIDKRPEEYWTDTSSTANYYSQVVQMCEDVIRGSDVGTFEETLRRFYMQNGHKLYGVSLLCQVMSRAAHAMISDDSKEKGWQIMSLFLKDRENIETTHNKEVNLRQTVDKLTKDGDLYRIGFTPGRLSGSGIATIQILHPDDNTFDMDDLTAEARWSYYVSSYTMRDQTEGIPTKMLHMPFLRRNLPPKMDSEEEYNRNYLPIQNEDHLVIRICTNTYHLLYEPHTTEWWVHGPRIRGAINKEKVDAVHEKRKERLNSKFVNNVAWMRDQSREDVDAVKEKYRRWIEDGPQQDEAGPSAVARGGGSDETVGATQ